MIAIRFEGGQELGAHLQTLSRRMSVGIMREGLRTVVAPPIQQRAVALVRRAPGAPDLADHIVIGTGRGDATTAAIVVGPSTEKRSDQPSRSFAVQGKYLEFGTALIQMFPFLRPAFDAEAPGTLAPLAAFLWDALRVRGIGLGRTVDGRGGPIAGGTGGGGLL